MGAFSLMHWLVVLLVVLIVFNAGKFPRMMRDLGEGIKTFRANVKDRDETRLIATADPEDRS